MPRRDRSVRVGGRPWKKGAGTVAERFWARVEKGDGCWLWIGYVRNSGYGVFCPHRGVALSAHRFSYEAANGPVPAGLLVCHTCDTPQCVRPDHLFVGTQRDNLRDMVAKKRWRRRREEAA